MDGRYQLFGVIVMFLSPLPNTATNTSSDIIMAELTHIKEILNDHGAKLDLVIGMNDTIMDISQKQTSMIDILLDVDECAMEKDYCDENAKCKNVIGSYKCTCNEGYIGDGIKCKPNCKELLHIEGLGCILMVNISMTWFDAVRNCEDKGMKLLGDITTKEQMASLKENFMGKMFFRSAWVEMRHKKWVSGKTPNLSVITNIGDCGDLDLDASPPELWQIPCDAPRPALCQSLNID